MFGYWFHCHGSENKKQNQNYKQTKIRNKIKRNFGGTLLTNQIEKMGGAPTL